MNKLLKINASIFATIAILSTGARAATQAFNTSTGAMDVNYAGYLSRNDVVFNAPITNPVNASQVGNGRLGMMVWNASGLTAQISGIDTSEQSSFSAGQIHFQTTPSIDTGYTHFQQRQSLYNGTVTTTYDGNRTITVFGSPNSEVMAIHVDDSRTGVTSGTFDLSLWNVSAEPNNAQVANMATWQTVSTYNDGTVIGLSRGQADPDNFGYTLAATVQGASFTTQTVNGTDVRLNITPSSSYTIWISCASRLNAPSHDSVTQARNLLSGVESTGYSSTLSSFQNWWHSFWGKSFVQYSNSNGTADYLENMYYLYSYILSCGSYGNYPLHFVNGDFASNQDNSDTQPKWPYAYWYWNERDCYNWCYASNHPEIMLPLNNLYSRNTSALQSFTSSRFGFSGIWVPETMGWNGNANNTMNSTYVKDIYTSATEVAQNMYNYYLYTGDQNYLANTAYPFMRQVAIFYQNKLAVNGSGKYWISLGNSHETYWDVADPITDQAAVRSLFPEIIKSAQLLGQDSGLVPQWQNIVNNMAPMPTDGSQYLPMDAPVASTHNNENVVMELLWPYAITGVGAPDYNLALTAWNNRPFPYGNVWSPDAIQAARLGLGDANYQGMQKMLQIYQNYPNGFTNNSNGMFEYQGVHLAAMNEGLMQSQNGVIRVFPSIPSDTTFVSSFTLAATGGFLVSSERDSGGIKYVGIKSVLGNTATVVNPWGAQQVDVRNMSTNAVVTTTSSSQFSFATTAGTVYVIERTSNLFSSYSHVQLTASQNNGQKTMGTNVIGAGSAGASEGPFNGTPASIPGTVQAENYDTGGVGVAYSVGSVNGNGTAYRSDGVDLESTSDIGGGYDMGWTSTGQWFKYTVNVASAGTYQVSFRYAAPNAVTDAFHISNSSGANLSGNVNLPTSTGWQTWGTVTANVTLPAGQQILTVNQDNGGWNVNSLTFASTGSSEAPYLGTPWAIPGTVQGENYDTGGEGVAYHDAEAANQGGQYRTSEGVDVETCSDTGGGFDEGWNSGGEWQRYTVNVSTAGTYTVTFRVANGTTGNGTLHLQNASGTNLSGAVTVAPTGGWQTWANVTANVTLPSGQQILTVWDDGGNYNLNYMTFASQGGAPPAAPTGLTATAGNASVSLSWAGSTGATSYNVYRGTSAGGEGTTAIASPTSTSYTNTGLTNGTKYYYTVKAVNASGTSGASNEANATPSGGVTGIDLIVTSVTWSPASPASGNHVVFSATVKNQGNTATPAGTIVGVQWAVDGVTSPITWSDTDTTSLGAGASVTLTANNGTGGSNFWTAGSGSHTVQAWVDDVNRIGESNENNNKTTATVSVP